MFYIVRCVVIKLINVLKKWNLKIQRKLIIILVWIFLFWLTDNTGLDCKLIYLYLYKYIDDYDPRINFQTIYKYKFSS